MIRAVFRLLMNMPGRSFEGPSPPAPRELRVGLRRDVELLAFERNEGRPVAYARAAELIEQALAEAGYATSRFAGNVIAELRGATDDIAVIGAHYDTVDRSPGADDNASGVAALLALARAFAHAKPKRTLRFVAFANEEPPYFLSQRMGSWQYANACHERRETIVAMLSLESIGFYSDAPHSQAYPAMLEHVFPDRANFIAFASNVASRALLKRCVETFREHARVPSEGAALPETVTGVAWSDQWSFWQFGYPAVMVTDTAPFRNPHYHTAHDTPETLDYDRFALVVEGLHAVVADLAGGTIPPP
jgi:Zn-dependent M28 family amino/carboxypeptidase